MTNVTLLRSIMVMRGLSVRQLAETIGIAVPTLYAKLNGAYPFKTDEIGNIAAVLGLTDKQIISIFFAKKLNNN